MKIFVCSSKKMTEDFEYNYSVLDEIRKRKIDKAYNKELSMAAGMALKSALEDRGYDYDKLVFSVDYNGKPTIENESVFFNVSHSGELAVAVASAESVGIDIQQLANMKRNILTRCFTLNEQKEIINSNNTDLYFTIFWAIKESYLKYLGVGIRRELNSFEVQYDATGQKAYIIEDNEIGIHIKVIGDYVIALCTKEQVSDIELINSYKNSYIRYR